ncbi:hypothetical protein [Acinetobacter equi]|jgi:hypothetical protein|uniref:Uncharacterized protein n=1 Tax=Acinetobacter equi TaxID=1324350 RepID=A0A0N9VYD2_9GAMM|nr:hypothetical protein [Acinetobacter equi]ALH94297.1 hypothetical protein AOY20_01365 [Acinetobacter equi]
MKDFFLNSTRIIESNPRIYWSIIIGIAVCLISFIGEAVYIQNLAESLATKDQTILKEAIYPITQKFKWFRIVIIILTVFWANFEYLKTKKKLGL